MELEANFPSEASRKANLSVWQDGAIVGLAIAKNQEPWLPRSIPAHANFTLSVSLCDSAWVQIIETMPDPRHYHCIVNDPSILHLVQLLQTEMQTPKRMNQIFVNSIAVILTTHLLQHWQTEQSQP